jgi:hypothetical protein
MTGLKIVIEPVLHISMVPVALGSSIEGTLHDNPRASVLFRRAWPIHQPTSSYGETMSRANIIRQQIWEKLKPVAKPDSRFHLYFAEVIPDFEDSEKVIDRLVAQPTYREGRYAFITPDNGLADLRRRMLDDGMTLVVSTQRLAARTGVSVSQPTLMTFSNWVPDPWDGRSDETICPREDQGTPTDGRRHAMSSARCAPRSTWSVSRLNRTHRS